MAAVRSAAEAHSLPEQGAAIPRARAGRFLAARIIPEVVAGAQVLRHQREKGIALLTDRDSARPSAVSWGCLPVRKPE